jgi:hypothetical protein
MTTKKTNYFPTQQQRWHTWAQMQKLFRQKIGRTPAIGCSIHAWVQKGKLMFAVDLPKPPPQRELFK